MGNSTSHPVEETVVEESVVDETVVDEIVVEETVVEETVVEETVVKTTAATRRIAWPYECKNDVIEIGSPSIKSRCGLIWAIYNLKYRDRQIVIPLYMCIIGEGKCHSVKNSTSNKVEYKFVIKVTENGHKFINTICNEASMLLNHSISYQKIINVTCEKNATFTLTDRICINKILISSNNCELLFAKVNIRDEIYNIFKCIYRLDIIDDIKYNIYTKLFLI